jgi:transposase
VRDHLRRHGIAAIIPQLRTETRPRMMDWQTHRERNVVERLVGRLKEHRRLTTRYNKLASSTEPSSISPRSSCGFENRA